MLNRRHVETECQIGDIAYSKANMGDSKHWVQNLDTCWYCVHSRGFWEIENKAKAIYNTKCKIGDESDTECKLGNTFNLRSK